MNVSLSLSTCLLFNCPLSFSLPLFLFVCLSLILHTILSVWLSKPVSNAGDPSLISLLESVSVFLFKCIDLSVNFSFFVVSFYPYAGLLSLSHDLYFCGYILLSVSVCLSVSVSVSLARSLLVASVCLRRCICLCHQMSVAQSASICLSIIVRLISYQSFVRVNSHALVGKHAAADASPSNLTSAYAAHTYTHAASVCIHNYPRISIYNHVITWPVIVTCISAIDCHILEYFVLSVYIMLNIYASVMRLCRHLVGG